LRNIALNHNIHVSGPPGSDISTQCSRICSHYKEFGWVHLSVGELIRQKISGGSDATQKWDAVRELVTNGGSYNGGVFFKYNARVSWQNLMPKQGLYSYVIFTR